MILSIEEKIMKKIVSIILLFSMLISMFTLTSCDKEEMALGLIKIIVDILFPPEPDTPPHTHTPSPIQAVESTCTEHGLTEGSYCLTCGEVLIPQREAPLKQHVYDSDSDAICNLCYYDFIIFFRSRKAFGQINLRSVFQTAKFVNIVNVDFLPIFV